MNPIFYTLAFPFNLTRVSRITFEKVQVHTNTTLGCNSHFTRSICVLVHRIDYCGSNHVTQCGILPGRERDRYVQRWCSFVGHSYSVKTTRFVTRVMALLCY